ncbi:MAG TPA: MBL fold metallo-hydrolase [Actinomycetota bacterium]|nr:MBL fold metallo-hydrolase [Actinomycetota bacterium]
MGISPGKTTALPNCGGDVRGYAMTQGNPDGGLSPPPTIEEVGGGIYAYLQLAGQWGLNNSAFVVGSGAVTLVDTCFTQRRTRALLEAVRSITDRPIATLFNTHEHGDHTWGNFLLPESTTVVGHERCREGMLAAGLWAQAVFPGVAWGDIVLRPPTVTFADRLTLWVDDLRLEARYVGPAHTTSDAVLWLPERRVLFSGDLVFNGGTPLVLMGLVKGSLAGLQRLKALGAETIVPGHGPVAGPGVLDDQIAYLRYVQTLAAEAASAGLSPLDAAREADLGRFAQWHDPERIVGNLARAYAELAGAEPGAPIDVAGALQSMVEYNGGRPLRCLA